MSSILNTLPRRLSLADVRPSLAVIRGSVPQLSKLGFTVLVSAILGVTVVLHVLIRAQLSQGAFTEQNMMLEVRASQAQLQSLQQQVTVMGAPATLQARAQKLGMVPMAAPVFIRLSDNTVLGVPKPATAASTKSGNVPTMDLSAVALSADGAQVLQVAQLPTDDGAVVVNSKASAK